MKNDSFTILKRQLNQRYDDFIANKIIPFRLNPILDQVAHNGQQIVFEGIKLDNTGSKGRLFQRFFIPFVAEIINDIPKLLSEYQKQNNPSNQQMRKLCQEIKDIATKQHQKIFDEIKKAEFTILYKPWPDYSQLDIFNSLAANWTLQVANDLVGSVMTGYQKQFGKWIHLCHQLKNKLFWPLVAAILIGVFFTPYFSSMHSYIWKKARVTEKLLISALGHQNAEKHIQK